eukprot:365224-Chlamydomonas_euryale.AAC.7
MGAHLVAAGRCLCSVKEPGWVCGLDHSPGVGCMQHGSLTGCGADVASLFYRLVLPCSSALARISQDTATQADVCSMLHAPAPGTLSRVADLPPLHASPT